MLMEPCCNQWGDKQRQSIYVFVAIECHAVQCKTISNTVYTFVLALGLFYENVCRMDMLPSILNLSVESASLAKRTLLSVKQFTLF